MSTNNLINFRRRKFFKAFFISSVSLNFLCFLNFKKDKSIITKKIGNEYWILSGEDL